MRYVCPTKTKSARIILCVVVASATFITIMAVVIPITLAMDIASSVISGLRSRSYEDRNRLEHGRYDRLDRYHCAINLKFSPLNSYISIRSSSSLLS
jgi:hypothetical protein